MDCLVADAGKRDWDEMTAEYGAVLMESLSGDYRQGLVLLFVPLTLLKHHLSSYPVPDWVLVPSGVWVHQQVYLHPCPKELMLRNHV